MDEKKTLLAQIAARQAYDKAKNTAEAPYNEGEKSPQADAEEQLQDQGWDMVQRTIPYPRRKQPTRKVQAKGKTKTQKSPKVLKKSGRKAKQTGQAAVKVAEETKKQVKRTAQNTVKLVRFTAHAAVIVGKAAVVVGKVIVKAVTALLKAIVTGVKTLASAIAAGGWVSVVIILLICLVGLVAASAYGVFFAGEEGVDGLSLPAVIRKVDAEYNDKIETIKAGHEYDKLETIGSRSSWSDVLAIYSVLLTQDKENPQDAATFNEQKAAFLRDVFWNMHTVSSALSERTELEIMQMEDEKGELIRQEVEVTRTYLIIYTERLSLDETMNLYAFDAEQQKMVTSLLADENRTAWNAALYGIGPGMNDIVAVALSQVGNVGGEPYWSWYGFPSRVEWCACFVSWCANECGYIQDGTLPRFSACVNGVNWFREHNRWQDNTYVPAPGDLIFYDWDKPETHGQDGRSDHVGIVEKVEDRYIYTIEGNSTGDACCQHKVKVGERTILGFGIIV